MAKKATTRSKGGVFSRKKLAKKAAKREGYDKLLEAFEKALKVLHKGDFDRARGQFQALATELSDDSGLSDRAQAYLAICDRQKKSKSSFSPRTFEEMVTYGVFCHNRGDYDRAIKYLSKAVDLEPKSDHAHYCLAAAHSRHGDARDATRHLKQAVAGDSYNRVLAKNDDDFDALRDEAEVAQLLATPE
jgi:tetratricopeptide (TPR) repeat protein